MSCNKNSKNLDIYTQIYFFAKSQTRIFVHLAVKSMPTHFAKQYQELKIHKVGNIEVKAKGLITYNVELKYIQSTHTKKIETKIQTMNSYYTGENELKTVKTNNDPMKSLRIAVHKMCYSYIKNLKKNTLIHVLLTDKKVIKPKMCQTNMNLSFLFLRKAMKQTTFQNILFIFI